LSSASFAASTLSFLFVPFATQAFLLGSHTITEATWGLMVALTQAAISHSSMRTFEFGCLEKNATMFRSLVP
jgi:hypothetical protein